MQNPIRLAVVLGAVALGQPAVAHHYGPDRNAGPPMAVFFTKPGFGGRSFTADHEIRKMSSKDMDDKTSSIQIVRGVWQVCVEDKFAGRCEIIDHSMPDLTYLHLDDKISSVRPVPPGAGGWNGPGNGNGYPPPPPHY